MKKILLFIVFLAYLKGYGQEGNIVIGYDYIGRNTFHLGIGLNTYLLPQGFILQNTREVLVAFLK